MSNRVNNPTMSRSLGLLTLIVAVLTGIWLLLLLVTELPAPPTATLAGRVANIEAHPTLFVLTYANAGLLTLACVAMLGGYYAHCRQDNPRWAAVALLFVPIYGLINTLVYLSQAVVIPQLLILYHDQQTAVLGETWLRLALHTWPGSAAEFFNALAYAILAIPTVIFGLILTRESINAREARQALGSRLGGVLLAASGLLSIVALAGVVAGDPLMALASPAGGFLFLLALLALSAHFLRRPWPAPGDPTLDLAA